MNTVVIYIKTKIIYKNTGQIIYINTPLYPNCAVSSWHKKYIQNAWFLIGFKENTHSDWLTVMIQE